MKKTKTEKPWKPTETDKYNADYFELPIERMKEHNALMQMYTAAWPEDLHAFCKAVSQKIGWCADVAACTVADWLKTQPVRDYPFDKAEWDAKLNATKTA